MLKSLQNHFFPQSAAIRSNPIESRVNALRLAFKIADELAACTDDTMTPTQFVQNKLDIMTEEALEPAYDPALHGDEIDDTPYYWLDPIDNRDTLHSFLAFKDMVTRIQPDNITINQVWNIGNDRGSRPMRIGRL